MTERPNILVVGGDGYIGSHLVSQLVEAGRKVTVLGRSASPRYGLPVGAMYINGDYGNHKLICDLLDSNEEVIHLAYATAPNTSFHTPIADLLENLSPTSQLFLEAAQRGSRLVFVSSGGTVYGEGVDIPISENHQTKPISSYGVTKLTLESYANLFSITHGLNYICVRPANPYGVGQNPFVGQGFISTAMASVMNGKPITIFGKTGTIRDYIYVTDVAAGIVSALEHGKIAETYNLGSGVGLTNLDVIDRFRPLLENKGFHVDIKHAEERVFDVKTNVLDSGKLAGHTGWKPQVEFYDGLAMTFDWLSRRLV